ncbi:ATP-binding domain-containing protein [Meiothermus rufus]|uniref:Dph6-related ATP pyrophosphatase n=1 Tax=Meiothermus rufus TaxID=604332 RepID=UPI000411D488|nr:ATP-binding domain-containing protein [Meiothermus rufus]
MHRVLLSWSSGKDSAWALYQLRQQPQVEVVGLLTTFNQTADRVSMHAVRRTLVEAQARAVGLPLWPVYLPHPCTNAQYEEAMHSVLQKARQEGITHLAFGDLFLQEVRDYRVRLLQGSGLEALFPLWTAPEKTAQLAQEMLAAGLQAVLTCLDPKRLSPMWLGQPYDAKLLAALPPGVDPCGERGEFHTFCYAGPMFAQSIPLRVGKTLWREGFCFADLLPAGPTRPPA